MSKPKIEAIYPLTFMQQALLFHSLSETDDQGFLQVQCTLKGRLDPALLQQAWSETTQRHQALRTSIHWEKIQKPVQVVHPAATLPWTIQDWRHLSKAQQEEKLEIFKNEGRARGLNLSTAPLSRIALFHLQDGENLLLWSCHHILLDGWSAAVILRDVFTFYEAACRGRETRLESLPSYRSYLNWLQGQDLQKAESFWKQELADFERTSSQEAISVSGNEAAPLFKDHFFSLTTERTSQLTSFTRQHRITLNTLVQGLWSILLSRRHHTHDVAFGTTVSGRSAALPNMEQMAGLFMNVLPMRVQLEPDKPFCEWLQDLQKHQMEIRNFEFVTLDQILAWVRWPGSIPLFDSLLVVENFPWDDLQAGEITVRNFAGGVTSTYPLTVIVKPGSQLEIQLRYDPRRISQKTASWMSRYFALLLNAPDSFPAATLAEVTARIKKTSPMPGEPFDLKKTKRTMPQDGNRSEYVAPQRVIELQLIKIWEEVFGRHPIGITENFFEIGGSSLLAVKLFARIEQKLERNLPPSALLQHPTIKDLARFLEEKESHNNWSALVPIRANGSRPPLFCIHAGGAHIFFYNAMADHLGADQPVYAMQPVGLDGTAAYAESIEEMATHYLEEIRSIQPQGPYALLGTCFSNAVCYEMAKQIQKAGQSIALLAIVDSGVVEPLPIPRPAQVRWQRFVRRWQQDPLEAIKKMIWIRLVKLRDAAENRLHFLKSRQAKNLLKMQNHLMKLYSAYQWTPFQGKITLIRSEEFHYSATFDYHITQWSDLAQDGLEVFVVPGKHLDLFEEPEVRLLAKQLRRCLDAAYVADK